uniref:BTB domain-containing protein n=1 Tax=Branchiostoma floridae TaxID=7739 RepID=C3Z2L6_BRAFL|eukprot:XP_002597255.1 hypothetical protein BRAFLDRAFT_66390 [Branchiostoma floridae]
MDEDSCPTSKIVDGGYAAWFFKELQKMRSEGLLVDVTLSAEGREIPCHRVVLATVNHYFRSMFSGSLSETKKDKIEMGGVSAESLQQLVDFAYTSKVDITEENVQPLFEAADMLQFHGVYGTCELFLEDRINEESCLGIWAQADRVSCTSLSEKAKIWALKWFEELCTTEEFLQLPVHLLKTYISDEGLLAKEEQILEAIMLWVKHDLKQREGHLKELLKCVCFSSLDQGYLKKILKKDKVLAKLPGIKQLTKSQSTHETPRHILQQDMLVLGGNWLVPHGNDLMENETDAVQVYDPSQNEWSYDMHLPVKASCIQACTVDSKMYIVGGYLECVVCIDPEEEKLHLLADRLFPWKQCSATVCGGEIYITGGRVHQLVHSDNGTQRQIENYSKVQCYNVKNDIMVLGKEMPKPLYGHCTVTIAKT